MATAGWVIRENDEAILIAGSLGGIDGGTSPQISEAVTIPKVAIIRRELLKACHTKPKRSRRGR